MPQKHSRTLTPGTEGYIEDVQHTLDNAYAKHAPVSLLPAERQAIAVIGSMVGAHNTQSEFLHVRVEQLQKSLLRIANTTQK